MNKKICVGALVALVVCMAVPANAGNQQTITITLDNYSEASIFLNKTTWDPDVPLGSSAYTANDYFNLDNNGSVQVDVDIKGANSVNWVLGTSAGVDQFALQYNLSSEWVEITTSDLDFVNDLTYEESQDFGLKIDMPTASSVSGVQTVVVTFTATAD